MALSICYTCTCTKINVVEALHDVLNGRLGEKIGTCNNYVFELWFNILELYWRV